ncbi:MAG: DUF1801 domain-containing protein [Chloroflexi bacterium]|nr:DUF1801 domain-containing protein [Chloroflexota bacterium]
MPQSKARTVEEYLAALPPSRREAIAAVRKIVLDHLPEGYEETMLWGMIAYVVPLKRYPNTYNRQPLEYAALASQKDYMSLYLMNVYADQEAARWFSEQYTASGKKLDMGKSCVRFKRVDDLPLGLIGEAIARTPLAEFIERVEASRRGPHPKRTSA